MPFVFTTVYTTTAQITFKSYAQLKAEIYIAGKWAKNEQEKE